ncbi:hypothetical protein GW17_00051572 [Ensete ventricosum]|nr:hypothetical protein GW17_00051572 [Ensete ventricosum]
MARDGWRSGIPWTCEVNHSTNWERDSSLPWTNPRREAVVDFGRALAKKFNSNSFANKSNEDIEAGLRREYQVLAGSQEQLCDRAGAIVKEAAWASAAWHSGGSASSWVSRAGTWFVRPRKASAVTMNGEGLDAGEGNHGSVIILQNRFGVGPAVVTSSVG